MKLLLQSDDYGMTKAVARGIIDGIENGLIKNTGMFTNMPWAEECSQWIKPYLDDIALGIDLNITTGSPILPPEEVSTLVKEDGTFYTSWQSRKLDTKENNFNHTAYEDVYNEFDAQIQKFIQLFNKKPDYIHSHAYGTDMTIQIQRELSKKYDIIYSSDAWKFIVNFEVPEYRMGWCMKPPTFENQARSSLKNYILENSQELLNKDYNVLVGHMGYVDKDLLDLSTYNLYRINDLDAVVSPEIKQWVKDNHVEMITYKDIVREMKGKLK